MDGDDELKKTHDVDVPNNSRYRFAAIKKASVAKKQYEKALESSSFNKLHLPRHQQRKSVNYLVSLGTLFLCPWTAQEIVVALRSGEQG